MGRGRDWNVGLIPKFLMVNGQLVKVLLYTKVTCYLIFKGLKGALSVREEKSTRELSLGFAGLSAIYGGTYMLNKPIEEIIVQNGRVIGVKSEGQVPYCKQLICDPSYVKDQVGKVGQVISYLHPQPTPSRTPMMPTPARSSFPRTKSYGSTREVYRHSTTVEAKEPEKEIRPALQLLELTEQKFVSISDHLVPKGLGTES
ncbi:hypothetical protein GH733_003295 [Mirounga leonina]|nr:hypothetical protein GH733_003295 [Mirounga leonina]